ncbi:putative arsinothricin biosynthesis methyltransferase ArsM [Paenibacillus sp. FSL M7-0420]|uniref:putative arsinothricin biosynthesis methyltransferase ArsM n=1 Tax=Paenibacillus sp. FSL M7-0420 TaxID=2921609 RepID=UPI0030FC4904
MSNQQTVSNNCCSEGPAPLTIASQTVRDFYNSVAEEEGLYPSGTDKFSPSGPTEMIIELVKHHGKKRILDIGCGMGTTLLQLVREFDEGTQFIGVDFSDKMVERAREKSADLPKELHKKVGFFVSDSQALPYMDEQFDLIYSECVFNLIPDREKAMKEVERLLSPGGIFIYTDFVSFVPVPQKIRDNLNFISGCRAGSILLSENISYMESHSFQHIQIHNFTEDKNKRYAELMSSSEEYKKDYEQFVNEAPEAVEFLEDKVGYYLICGVKAQP